MTALLGGAPRRQNRRAMDLPVRDYDLIREMKNAFNHCLRLVTSARTHGRKAARAFPTTVSAVRKGRRRQAADPTPAKALALLKTLHSADIILPMTEGREIRLRRVTEPPGEQKKLLPQLALTVPERFTWDRKWSVDSAVA